MCFNKPKVQFLNYTFWAYRG